MGVVSLPISHLMNMKLSHVIIYRCYRLRIIVFRLPQIYEEFYHTINNADHEKDLKWWSNNHGVNMAMNWPQFEVSSLTLVAKKSSTKSSTVACKSPARG